MQHDFSLPFIMPPREEAARLGKVHFEGKRCVRAPNHGTQRYVSNGGCVACQCGTPEERAFRAKTKKEQRRIRAPSENQWGALMHASGPITLQERDELDAIAASDPAWLDAMLAFVRAMR